MWPEDVLGTGGRFARNDRQGHVGVFQPATSLKMIAGRAGRNDVRPGMCSTQVTGQDMVNRQIVHPPPAVLTGIIITAKYFAPGEFDARARAVNHVLQADNGRARERRRDGFNFAASIGNQRGFSAQHQPDCTPHVADINWLEVGIQYQHIHSVSKTWQIILQCHCSEDYMNILIAGGTGFIGSALTRSLLADGHKVWVLTRSPARARLALAPGAQAVGWDGRSVGNWLDVFSQMDAVVNLVGENVGRWPWTAERKQRIRDSRVAAGATLASAFQKASRRPAVLIQSSGVGYYGPCGSEPVTENNPAGSDFFASVAVDWEASSRLVDSLGVRRVVIRTSLVLDSRAGILPLMALPIRLFAGGPLGDGKQGISWIHIEDHIRAICFLLENQRAIGAFNLSAPNPLSNADFMAALAKTLRRPYWLPVPAFALRLALGEMSTLLLDGQFALPQRLVNLGFVFKFETVSEAFKSLFER